MIVVGSSQGKSLQTSGKDTPERRLEDPRLLGFEKGNKKVGFSPSTKNFNDEDGIESPGNTGKS